MSSDKNFNEKNFNVKNFVKNFNVKKDNIIIAVLIVIMIISATVIIKDRLDYHKQKNLSREASNIYETAIQQKNSPSEPTESKLESELNNISEPLQNNVQNNVLEKNNVLEENTVPTPTIRPVRDIQDEFIALREAYNNDDIVGYIRINGTTIDYPVVQASDNEFYLTHDINKEIIRSGSIFMDYENDVSREDRNIILYGHNMKEPIMFHDMRKYKDESYYQEHRYIIFNTLYDNYVWEIFSFYETNTDFYYIQVFFDNTAEFYELLQEMKSRSIYDTGVEVNENDRILTLSTCTNNDPDTRFVINARLITNLNEIPIDMQIIAD